MKEKIERFEYLQEYLADLGKAPQTVDREFEMACLDIELTILESFIQSAVSARILSFLHAWRQTGSFVAIREDGERQELNPTITNDRIQNFWNVQSEAHRLANWSFGINNPWLS